MLSPKIHATFWTDDAVGELPPDQKLAFLWLITNGETNNVGFLKVSQRKFKHDTGLDFKTLQDLCKGYTNGVLSEEVDGGFCVLVRNYMKHQWTDGQWGNNPRIRINLCGLVWKLPERFRAALFADYKPLQELSKTYLHQQESSRVLKTPELNCTELNRSDPREGGVGEGKGEVQSPKSKVQSPGVEVPGDDEVLAFASSWPGEPASGAPPMPPGWVAEWLRQMNGRTLGWPLDWRRALIASWRAVFRTWGQGSGGRKKVAGAWELTQRRAALEEEARRHPANENSAARVGEPTAEEQADYERLRAELREVEKELTQ